MKFEHPKPRWNTAATVGILLGAMAASLAIFATGGHSQPPQVQALERPTPAQAPVEEPIAPAKDADSPPSESPLRQAPKAGKATPSAAPQPPSDSPNGPANGGERGPILLPPTDANPSKAGSRNRNPFLEAIIDQFSNSPIVAPDAPIPAESHRAFPPIDAPDNRNVPATDLQRPPAGASERNVPQLDADNPPAAVPTPYVSPQQPKRAADILKPLQPNLDPYGLVESRVQISATRTTKQKQIAALIESLKGLGTLKNIRLSTTLGPKNTVVVTVPANITWRGVRQIEAALAQHPAFEARVLVAGNDAPATSTMQPSTSPATPHAYIPLGAPRPPVLAPTAVAPRTKSYPLKYAKAEAVGEIVQQLFRSNMDEINISVDERTNVVLVRTDDRRHKEIAELILTLDAQGGRSPREAKPTGEMFRPSLTLQAPSRTQASKESTVDSVRARYQRLEQQARALATKMREPMPSPLAAEKLKNELRVTLRQAFEARQEIQRRELAAFSKRLEKIRNAIEQREKIADKVIERRMQELLDPNLYWEPPAANQNRSIKSAVGELNLAYPKGHLNTPVRLFGTPDAIFFGS